MVNLRELNTEDFEIIRVSDVIQEQIEDFKAKEDGYGLEVYFKEKALVEEERNETRTYVVIDSTSKQIVSYFSLRTGLITVSRGFMRGFNTRTGIELSNFAVNDNYRHNKQIPKIGSFVFWRFILPLVREISNYVGAEFLYIFALPHDRLMEHYKTLGFQKASGKVERFVYSHVKPAYDKSCRFMLQKIDSSIR